MSNLLSSLSKTVHTSLAIAILLFLGLYYLNDGIAFDTLFWGVNSSIAKFCKLIDHFDDLFLEKKSPFYLYQTIGMYWPEIFYEIFLNKNGIYLQCYKVAALIKRKEKVQKLFHKQKNEK